MAAEMKLNFIIDAQDKTKAAMKSAQKGMNKFQDRVKSMGPTFKKMALIGVAAFGAITYAAGTSIKAAMMAEGAYNKFNTVFGEHKDDMLKFVKDLRTRMPTAEHEIVKLAAGLQDLLVPMGVDRKEATKMTQGFLDLSNQIAAFNDVSPEEVITAIGSALVGSSEPMRRFGVDTRILTLEATALAEGLIKEGESFIELEPEVRAQITAQAVLIQITKQSADAIAGFEENQDSALRRTQELSASIIDNKVAIGDALLPLYDSILKKMLPILENMGNWIRENPKLTKIILIAVTAIAGLVTILGTLGLVLPGIITMFGMLSAASLPITAIILAIIVVIGLFIAIGWMLYKDWDLIIAGFKIYLGEFKAFWINVWATIRDFFVSVWDKIKTTIGSAIDWLMIKIQPFIKAFETVKAGAAWIGEKAGRTTEWLGFQKGGVVPGMPGQAVPIIAHAGETIIPAGAGIGGNIYITMESPMFLSEDAMETFGEELANELKRNMKL